MNPAVISALAALCGSSIGALAPVLSNFVIQRSQTQRDVLTRHIAQREQLYSDFITQASRLYADSFVNHLEKLDSAVTLYALVSRIRLLASPPVLQGAEECAREIFRQYGEPNYTAEQIRASTLSATVYPLDLFSTACRMELDTILQFGGVPNRIRRSNLEKTPSSTDPNAPRSRSGRGSH